MLDFLIGFFWGSGEESKEKTQSKLETAMLVELLLLIVGFVVFVRITA